MHAYTDDLCCSSSVFYIEKWIFRLMSCINRHSATMTDRVKALALVLWFILAIIDFLVEYFRGYVLNF